MLQAEMIGSILSGSRDARSQLADAESALLERLREGDQEAYEQLVRRHGPAIYRVSMRLLGDAEEVREVTQETFVKVFRYIHRLRGDGGLMNWIFRIAMNQAANHRRWWRQHRRGATVSLTCVPNGDGPSWPEQIADRSANPEEDLLSRESRRLLLESLGRVGSRFRATLVLRDIEGFSYEQISEILSISMGTVKSRIARGRAQLKREMERRGWTAPQRLTGSGPIKTAPMGCRRDV